MGTAGSSENRTPTARQGALTTPSPLGSCLILAWLDKYPANTCLYSPVVICTKRRQKHKHRKAGKQGPPPMQLPPSCLPGRTGLQPRPHRANTGQIPAWLYSDPGIHKHTHFQGRSENGSPAGKHTCQTYIPPQTTRTVIASCIDDAIL